MGYDTKYIEFENVERVAGETKWNFWSLFSYAIEGIVAYTTAPLRMATYIGLLMSMLGFIFMLYIVVKALLVGDPVAGYPSTIVLITLIAVFSCWYLGSWENTCPRPMWRPRRGRYT